MSEGERLMGRIREEEKRKAEYHRALEGGTLLAQYIRLRYEAVRLGILGESAEQRAQDVCWLDRLRRLVQIVVEKQEDGR